MSDPTTTNIILAVPPRGVDVGTWDVPLNGDMTIIDACFGTVSTVALSNVPVSLTVTQVQSNLLRFTGTIVGNIAVTVPAIVKSWYVENLCVVGASLYVTLGNASGGQIVGLPPGEIVQVISDGTNIKFANLGRVGTYLDDASIVVPSWITACTVPPYLNCDGSIYSAVTYPALFAKIGTTTLPDLRGRSRAALNQGTGRITTAISGIDGNTIFSAGGTDGITLTAPQVPIITPTGLVSAPIITFTNGNFSLAGSAAAGFSPGGGLAPIALGSINPTVTSSAPIFTGNAFGGGLAHPNMGPVQISGITMIRAA